jgi:peptidoglycan-associated lipoprotein
VVELTSPEKPKRRVMNYRTRQISIIVVMLVAALVATSCGRRRAATPQPAPTPRATSEPPVVTAAPPPPTRVDDALPVPPQPLSEDSVANRSLDELNRDSPLKPVLFGLDSADLDDIGRSIAIANAEVLKKYPSWVVTVEGHCDERGTAEYNLALGERRATAVKTYLTSLGISPERVRTVSYGKEFPFSPGHTEEAWAQNRRGHFVITSR